MSDFFWGFLFGSALVTLLALLLTVPARRLGERFLDGDKESGTQIEQAPSSDRNVRLPDDENWQVVVPEDWRKHGQRPPWN